MGPRRNYYLGKYVENHPEYPGKIVFSTYRIPNYETHPEFSHIVGPFITKRAAEYMRSFGENNPHLQTVADAEYLSKLALYDEDRWF